ncbi:MAG: CRISPR-associated endonuclease Cas1 [Campylobacterales bacterium]
MFRTKLEQIYTPEALTTSLARINPHTRGIDGIDLSTFKANQEANIQTLITEILAESYAPEPLKQIAIPKESGNETRPIGLSSVRDKLVQTTLAYALTPHFDKTFSNKSYAYRPGKSHIKALNRAKNFLDQKLSWVLKTDIDNFFETIDHALLLSFLSQEIEDSRIIRLISLFIHNGAFKNIDYLHHLEGVHQGDSLSPLLSNIYLDRMDKFLESKNVAFVRYADDFAIFCTTKEECEKLLSELNTFLATLKLKLDNDKTYITHVNDGFSFLGARFHGHNRFIDPKHFEKTKQQLHALAHHPNTLQEFLDDLSTHIAAIKRYYLQIISPDTTQAKELQHTLMETISNKIAKEKLAGRLKTKSECRALLENLPMILDYPNEERAAKINVIIAKAWQKVASAKAPKKEAILLEKKKETYSRQLTNAAHLHITKPGIILGIAKNRIIVKEQGKVTKSYPKSHLRHIIISASGVSLSTNLIHTCAQEGIAIDFIDTNHYPYASFITYNAALAQNTLKQLEIHAKGEGLELAKEFIEGKAKNQINYIKYLNKYHKRFDAIIASMEQTLHKAKAFAANPSELMGYEGTISAHYWSAIQSIMDEQWGFSARITQGAQDTINSCLNYGYAILYGKVRHALVKAGLSLHVSYLHAFDARKPTLVFDAIEEFRTFIVDRTIISMANKNEPLAVGKDGLLTDETKKLVAKNIFERLGSYTIWKKSSWRVEQIIYEQAYALARHINGEERYNSFIGKY